MILPEGTPIGFGLSHASLLGVPTPSSERLRNTWSTYPRGQDNPWKLGLILDRGEVQECLRPQSRREGYGLVEALGWDHVPSGCRWGNGPPSRRRVRAVRAGARRWALRQGPRSYGAQQIRKFRNARKRDGASPSAILNGWLSRSLNSSG